jgi:hypothetical protein
LLRHAAVIHTRKQKKTRPRSVSLSPSLPFPIIRPDRVIDPSSIRHHPSIRHPHHPPPRASLLAHPPPRSPRSPPPRARISRVPLKRGDGASGNGRSREHDGTIYRFARRGRVCRARDTTTTDLVGIRGEVGGTRRVVTRAWETHATAGWDGGAEIRRSARVIATMCACACVCETVNT